MANIKSITEAAKLAKQLTCKCGHQGKLTHEGRMYRCNRKGTKHER